MIKYAINYLMLFNMPTKEEEESLEERANGCRIHQWAGGIRGVERFLEESCVPRKYWEAYHEMLIVRSQKSIVMDRDEEEDYIRETIRIYEEYRLESKFYLPLYIIVLELVGQWKRYKRSLI